MQILNQKVTFCNFGAQEPKNVCQNTLPCWASSLRTMMITLNKDQRDSAWVSQRIQIGFVKNPVKKNKT
jgi:hypothetical protein